MAPLLQEAAGPLQLGTVRHGVTYGPILAVQTFLRRAAAAGKPAAVLFSDIVGAFYSVLPEVLLGELLDSENRVAALSKAGLTPDEAESFIQRFISHGQALVQNGSDGWWCDVVADWCQLTWF